MKEFLFVPITFEMNTDGREAKPFSFCIKYKCTSMEYNGTSYLQRYTHFNI